jgi:hypothetical protein
MIRIIIWIASLITALTGAAKGADGIASHYDRSSGSKVACGGELDESALTAAHKTLPCGTRVRSPYIAAMNLFVAPTIAFNLMYVLVIVRLVRRELVWINVTPHPTAEWIAQQITDAFPWDEVHAI